MTLKEMISSPDILIAPGVYDAFSARIAEQCGSRALYLSGASIAYTRLGRPDIGLVEMGDVAQVLTAVRERVELPIIVDADTGFGNAVNVQRTLRAFERAGADAIQLEDQTMPKRCGHLTGKSLISSDEMVGKIKAAVDARERALIIARTDAAAVEGLDLAIERAEAYAEAGADVLFVEALTSVEDMKAAISALHPKAPMLANMVEGGKTPLLSRAELQDLGYSVAIFPGGAVRALTRQLQSFYGCLAENGSTVPFLEHMADFTEVNEIVGTSALIEYARKYA